MTIKVEEYRKLLEARYVGFSPNTTSVKPVHLANGLFRAMSGEVSDTSDIVRFAVTQLHSGQIPKGHDLESIKDRLIEHDAIDLDVTDVELGRLRAMIRRILSADGALYVQGMDSHSAMGRRFLSKDRIGQDAGEFLAAWIKSVACDLQACIVESLDDESDAISLLCAPVSRASTSPLLPDPPFSLSVRIEEFSADSRSLWCGMGEAATSLGKHLIDHPSKLLRARSAVLFVGFAIARYLASLESAYVPDSKGPAPFLVIFDEQNRSILEASRTAYQHVGQSLARFYAWSFGQTLKDHFSLEDLSLEDPPQYKEKTKLADQLKEIWQVALQSAGDSEDAYTTFGQALYDILAMEAEASPVAYLRSLSIRLGLAGPASNAQPNKRFRLGLDLLEVLLKGAVEPGESNITLEELLERLWVRYRIVVGGRDIDLERLQAAGMFTADADSLRMNRNEMLPVLTDLSVARLMADGVVEIGFGGLQ